MAYSPLVKQEKSAATKLYERETRIKRLKERLREIKAYKEILIEDGLEPDLEDKKLESELIIQLLRLEKGLPAKAKPKENRRQKKKKKLASQKNVEVPANSRKQRGHKKLANKAKAVKDI